MQQYGGKQEDIKNACKDAEEERDAALGDRQRMKEADDDETNASHYQKIKENVGMESLEWDDKLPEKDTSSQELEAELDKGKGLEKQMLHSFNAQKEQLEQTQKLLQDSQLEMFSHRETIKRQEASSGVQQESEFLKDGATQDEKHSELKEKNLLEEMELLKRELELATKAEENSKKALDDLALALKEVATEANQAKEKLASTQEETENFIKEAQELNKKLQITEEKHKIELDQVRKECDCYSNTAKRLKLEAEESVLAWNAKETGFIECIKRAELERHAASEENSRLLELLKDTENMNKIAKDENQKLRDILKQALNEANVAREAAGIAQAENSQLKDRLAEKDDALMFITRENENLRINEAAALEEIKELKRLVVAEGSEKEGKAEEKEHQTKLKPQSWVDKEQAKDSGKKLSGGGFSFNLRELITPLRYKDTDKDQKTLDSKNKDEENGGDGEDGEDSDPLKGSIFDPKAESSPVAAVSHQQKKSGSGLSTEDGETVNTDDYEEGNQVEYDTENERNSRKKKALLRRFGDILIRRRSAHSREQSLGGDQDHKKEKESLGDIL